MTAWWTDRRRGKWRSVLSGRVTAKWQSLGDARSHSVAVAKQASRNPFTCSTGSKMEGKKGKNWTYPSYRVVPLVTLRWMYFENKIKLSHFYTKKHLCWPVKKSTSQPMLSNGIHLLVNMLLSVVAHCNQALMLWCVHDFCVINCRLYGLYLLFAIRWLKSSRRRKRGGG